LKANLFVLFWLLFFAIEDNGKVEAFHHHLFVFVAIDIFVTEGA
jgi:hypothetical protein